MKNILLKRAKAQEPFIWGFSECIILTSFTFALCILLNKDDPFSMNSGFPWLWVATILIALRYGTFLGMISAIIIIIGISVYMPNQIFTNVSYQLYIVGGVIVGVICGEFHNHWIKQVQTATATKNYISEKLITMSRAYHLLKLSHDRMEHNFISKTVTLRDAVKNIYIKTIANGGILNQKSLMQLLELFDQFCQLEQAAIYSIKEKKISQTPIAYIGLKSKINTDDVLVKNCIEKKQISYIANEGIDSVSQSLYLVCLPIQTQSGIIIGIVVIKKMPFWLINHENLQILNILTNYIMSQIYAVKTAKRLILEYPDCPPQFAQEIYKMTQMRKDMGIESTLIKFTVSSNLHEYSIILKSIHQHRCLDCLWHMKSADCESILVLMPFSSPYGCEGYLNRIEQWLMQQFNLDFSSAHLSIHHFQITSDHPCSQLTQLIEAV